MSGNNINGMRAKNWRPLQTKQIIDAASKPANLDVEQQRLISVITGIIEAAAETLYSTAANDKYRYIVDLIIERIESVVSKNDTTNLDNIKSTIKESFQENSNTTKEQLQNSLKKLSNENIKAIKNAIDSAISEAKFDGNIDNSIFIKIDNKLDNILENFNEQKWEIKKEFENIFNQKFSELNKKEDKKSENNKDKNILLKKQKTDKLDYIKLASIISSQVSNVIQSIMKQSTKKFEKIILATASLDGAGTSKNISKKKQQSTTKMLNDAIKSKIPTETIIPSEDVNKTIKKQGLVSKAFNMTPIGMITNTALKIISPITGAIKSIGNAVFSLTKSFAKFSIKMLKWISKGIFETFLIMLKNPMGAYALGFVFGYMWQKFFKDKFDDFESFKKLAIEKFNVITEFIDDIDKYGFVGAIAERQKRALQNSKLIEKQAEERIKLTKWLLDAQIAAQKESIAISEKIGNTKDQTEKNKKIVERNKQIIEAANQYKTNKEELEKIQKSLNFLEDANLRMYVVNPDALPKWLPDFMKKTVSAGGNITKILKEQQQKYKELTEKQIQILKTNALDLSDTNAEQLTKIAKDGIAAAMQLKQYEDITMPMVTAATGENVNSLQDNVNSLEKQTANAWNEAKFSVLTPLEFFEKQKALSAAVATLRKARGELTAEQNLQKTAVAKQFQEFAKLIYDSLKGPIDKEDNKKYEKVKNYLKEQEKLYKQFIELHKNELNFKRVLSDPNVNLSDNDKEKYKKALDQIIKNKEQLLQSNILLKNIVDAQELKNLNSDIFSEKRPEIQRLANNLVKSEIENGNLSDETVKLWQTVFKSYSMPIETTKTKLLSLFKQNNEQQTIKIKDRDNTNTSSATQTNSLTKPLNNIELGITNLQETSAKKEKEQELRDTEIKNILLAIKKQNDTLNAQLQRRNQTDIIAFPSQRPFSNIATIDNQPIVPDIN